MYTVHSLHAMQMTSRTPTVHVPQGVLREFGPGARDRVINALENVRACEQSLSDEHVRRAVMLRRRSIVETTDRLLAGISAWLRTRFARAAAGAES
jgi:hypothetical protein